MKRLWSCLWIVSLTLLLFSCKFAGRDASETGVSEEEQLYVVSWNVQTFFDAQTSGLEYTEFRGSKSIWSQQLYENRLDRLVDAIESGLPIEDVREFVRKYLSEQQISEDMTDEGFTSWYCLDYSGVKNVGLEFGYYSIDGDVFGFVLYDNKDVGEMTAYNKLGLDHRWDWTGSYGGSYSFVISPEGYGRYYDFTNVPDGESIKPRDVYKVRKR